MKQFPWARRALACLALGVLLAGCAAPELHWPFPPSAGRSDAEVVATLRQRTSGVQSLYAVLNIAFEMPERSGVATLVVRYQEPGTVRMTAFRDMLVMSRDIFDLVMTPERFDLRIQTDSGVDHQTGKPEDLSRLHPSFRFLTALRQAMFLPGWCESGSSPQVFRAAQAIQVRTLSPTGYFLEWELDSATLGVRHGRSRLHDTTVDVEYTSYVEAPGGVFIPERFELHDSERQMRLTGVLEEVEVNPELDPDAFRWQD